MVSDVIEEPRCDDYWRMSKQHRPQLDWTPDAKLPTRFKHWKAEIEDEVLLFEGEAKPSKYICNFVKVCSGERGKAILAETNAYKEEKDVNVLFDALEKKVKPSNESSNPPPMQNSIPAMLNMSKFKIQDGGY